MDLKLNNNQHLTVSTFPDSIKAKITTVYIKDCREITENAFSFLNSIMSLQESVTPKLSRIRVDIGARAGSYSDLMKFSNLQGFDDDYNFQAKPRFVGSYYIDSWHTIKQLNNARSIFESADFTISNDSTKLINFDDLAVQTLDSTKPNYNPAVAIILQGKNKGNTISNSVVSGGGRWFLTKSQAAAITNMFDRDGGGYISWFAQKVTVTDTNAIVSDDETLTYDFSSFEEYRFFTNIVNHPVGYKERGLFANCSKLTKVTLPSHLTGLSAYSFRGCSLLTTVNIDNITAIGNFCFHGCANLILSDISHVTNIGGGAFASCANITITEINESVTNIPESINIMNTFGYTTSIPYLHFLSPTPVTGLLNYASSHIYCPFYHTSYKIYVGDGSSAHNDDAILAAYQASSNWSANASRLDTWYNFSHPQS